MEMSNNSLLSSIFGIFSLSSSEQLETSFKHENVIVMLLLKTHTQLHIILKNKIAPKSSLAL
jgi:hypothetical protein